jgi:hypothetical protein
MIIIKIYEYIYYRIYDFQAPWAKAGYAWSSIAFLSLFESMFIIKNIAKTFHSRNFEVAFFIGTYLTFILINYFLLYRNKKYKSINMRFKNETRRTKTIGRISLVILILIGFILFV